MYASWLGAAAGSMADRRRVTVSTPRGPFEVEVSALLPQTDLSVEVAPAADAGAGQPQRQRRPLDYAQLPSDEELLDQRGEKFVSRAELEAIRAERDHRRARGERAMPGLRETEPVLSAEEWAARAIAEGGGGVPCGRPPRVAHVFRRNASLKSVLKSVG